MSQSQHLESQPQSLVWASRLLLLYGVGLVLTGVIFFVAYNLDELTGLSKLLLLQTGILGCAAGGAWSRLSPTVRRAMRVAAAVLIGAFLAVFGQVYQTGADAWQLFVLWAILMAPFIALARSQGGWLIFAAVASIGSILFLSQTFQLARLADFVLPNSVALVWGSVWIALEWWRDRYDPAWLRAMWIRGAFATLVFGPLVIPELVASVETHSLVMRVVQFALLVVVTWIVGERFISRETDAAVVTVAGLAWLGLVVVRTGSVLDQAVGHTLSFFLTGVVVICGTSMLTNFVRSLTDEPEKDQ